MPVYNTAAYLSRCIESLVNQTYSDLQIILIDDGSTDNSGAIADEWQAKDSRIEVYHQPNQGQSAARNAGLQHAKGEYIAFVDSDDYIDSNYFAIMFSAMEECNDYVQIGYKRIDLQGNIIALCQPRYFCQYTTPWGKMYRKTFLEKHHLHFPEGMIYEDVVFSIDLWLAHPTYKLIPYCGYNYTLNTSSTTFRKRPQAEKALYRLLKQRWQTASSITDRLLIAYTIIRLKIHFLYATRL